MSSVNFLLSCFSLMSLHPSFFSTHIFPLCGYRLKGNWAVMGIIPDFPGGPVVKNPPANAGARGDVGSVPGSGRCPGEEDGNPLQYSCLGNPMDREAWRAAVHGVTKSWVQLGNWAQTQGMVPKSETWPRPVITVTSQRTVCWCMLQGQSLVSQPDREDAISQEHGALGLGKQGRTWYRLAHSLLQLQVGVYRGN